MAKYEFDRDKYSKTFNNMFGEGAYERGMSSARTTGTKKVEASLARKEYEAQQKAKKAAEDKAAKEKAKQAAIQASMTPADSKKKEDKKATPSSSEAKKSSNVKDDSFLGKLASGAKTVLKEAKRFDSRIGNALSFGLLGEVDKRTEKKLQAKGKDVDMTSYMDKREDGNIVGKGVDLVSDMVGYGLGGIGGVGALRGLGATGKGINALQQAHKAGTVTKPILKKGALDSLKEGAITGGALTAAESAVRLGLNKEADTTATDELKRIALGTALGGALDPLMTAAAPALKMASRNSIDNIIGKQASNNVSAGLKNAEGNAAATGDIIREQMRQGSTIDGLRNQTSADRMLRMLSQSDNAAPKSANALELANPKANESRRVMEELSNQASNSNKALHPRSAEKKLEQLIGNTRKNLPVSQTNRDAQLPTNEKVNASDSVPFNVLASPAKKEKVNPMDLISNPRPVRDVEAPAKVEVDRSFVDRTVKKPKAEKGELSTKIQKQFVNDTAGLRQIDEKMKELDIDGTMELLKPKVLIKARKEQLATNSSLEKSTINAKGAHSVAANHVTKRFEPFLKKVNANKATNTKEIGDYAFARHGIKLLDDSAESRATRDGLLQEIEALKRTVGANSPELKAMEEMLDKYTAYQMPEGATYETLQAQIAKFEQNPELVKSYEEFIALQQQNLDDMLEGEMITEGLHASLVQNPTYISMHRNFASDSATVGGASRRPQSPLERMQSGSEEMIKDPIQEAIRNAYTTRFNIEKNNALKVVEKFAKIDKDATMFKGVTEPNSNTITVFANGKPKHYEVPPALKSYVDNFNANSDPDILTNTLQGLAQMQRKLTTQYSLAFQLKSLVREPVQAITISRTAKTSVHAAKNVALGYVDALVGPQLQALTKDLPKHLQFNSYKAKWDEMGGTGFQFINMSDGDLQRVAKDMMEGGTAKGNIKKMNPFRMLGKFGEKIEEGPRLGEFRSAKGQGYSDADAFYEATDITNYKRSGDFTRTANKYIPFLNATIQGNSRVLRAISEAPERTIARGVTMLTTTSAAAYGMRYMDGVSDEQRKELKNLSQWEKDSYLHIPSPMEGDDTIFAIPKAFAVGQMFMNPMERALDDYYDAMMKEESVPDHVREGIKNTFKSFVPPYEIAGITTAIELKQNKSLFSGQEIESSFDKSAGVPKKDIEAYNQSWVTKQISDVLNAMTFSSDGEGWVSPAQVDYVMKDLTGSVGTRALEMLDQDLSPNAPSKTLQDQLAAPLKQFVSDPTRASGVYSELQKLAKVEKRSNNSMSGMTEDEKNVERSSRSTQNFEAAFKDINKQIQAIRSDSSLSSQEKKDAITQLRKEQDTLGSNAIDWYNSIK